MWQLNATNPTGSALGECDSMWHQSMAGLVIDDVGTEIVFDSRNQQEILYQSQVEVEVEK